MDLLLNTISVIINEILYQRTVYPSKCFVIETHLGVPMHGLHPKHFDLGRHYISDWLASIAPYLSRSKVSSIIIALYADGKLYESHIIKFSGIFQSSTLVEDQIKRILRRLLLLRAVMQSPPDSMNKTFRLYVRTVNPDIARQIVDNTKKWVYVPDDELTTQSVLVPVETLSGSQGFQMAVVARQVSNI